MSVVQRLADRRAAALFVASVAAVNVASLAGNAVAFRWVDPVSMGIWHTLLLASSYIVVIRLGLISGMGRELPFALGRQDVEAARRIAATGLGYSIVCCVVAGLLFGIFAIVYWPAGEAWRWALPAMAVVAATNLYVSYVSATFRSDSDFARLARVHWVHVGTLALMPLFVYRYGFAGLCVHAALQAVIIAAYSHAVRPLRVPPAFDWSVARQLLLTGLPLFTAGYLQTVATGFDRIILLQRGGVEAVGYYAPAIAVIHAMAIVPGAVSTYVYPRMSYVLGQGREGGAVRRMALDAGAVSFLAGLPVAVAGWIAAPYVVARFFPQYLPSVPAVQWSLLSGLLLSVAPAVQVLGSLKAWRSLSLYIAVLLATRWMFPWVLSQVREPLEGVALGNVAAAAVAGVVALIVVRRATLHAAQEQAA